VNLLRASFDRERKLLMNQIELFEVETDLEDESQVNLRA
jgi:hypothetical protein